MKLFRERFTLVFPGPKWSHSFTSIFSSYTYGDFRFVMGLPPVIHFQMDSPSSELGGSLLHYGTPPGLQMAFIDGNQTERLCEPMKQYIEERGGQVLLNQPLASVLASPFLQELPEKLWRCWWEMALERERERELFISFYISFRCWLFGGYYYFHGGFYLFWLLVIPLILPC